jgi:hypothetical protein
VSLTGLQRGRRAEVARLFGGLAPLFLSISLAACVAASPTASGTAPAASRAPRASVIASGARCTLRVIVSFAQGDAPAPPDAAFLQELASAARLELTYVRSLTPALHVFVLSADGADDPDCQQALGRLRSDPRVRSADTDQRRQPQR